MLCPTEIHLLILSKLLMGLITVSRRKMLTPVPCALLLACLYPMSESDSLSLHLGKEKGFHCTHEVLMAHCIAINTY